MVEAPISHMPDGTGPSQISTPLSSGETRGVKSVICPTVKAEYFCVKGWTDFW